MTYFFVGVWNIKVLIVSQMANQTKMVRFNMEKGNAVDDDNQIIMNEKFLNEDNIDEIEYAYELFR